MEEEDDDGIALTTTMEDEEDDDEDVAPIGSMHNHDVLIGQLYSGICRRISSDRSIFDRAEKNTGNCVSIEL